MHYYNALEQQECIPVGCVPAARRPYAGVCFPGLGLPGPEGGGVVCLVQGGASLAGGWGSPCQWGGGVLPGRGGVVCLVRGGLLAQGGSPCRGGLPGPRGDGLPGSGGISLPRGGSPCWGVFSLQGGGSPSWGGFSLPRDPPPVNRITHTCKNITLATTSLWPIKMVSCSVGAPNKMLGI